ncbi:MAG: DNA translocase FtsK, partial [Clostridioides difficile]|nr:DNA translocase FtsK [Clostridioides difficile]
MATKKKKKKKVNTLSFNAEYHNLITIFIGVFLLYSLNSNSMGWIPVLMQNLFKGLFGGLSIAIPFIVIITGLLGFFDGNEYIYRLRKTKLYYIIILFIFVFYGLLNAGTLPVDSPLKGNMFDDVMKLGVSGQGSGLIATTIAYYMSKIFGIAGGWLISIFALILSVMFIFNISIKDLVSNAKSKSKASKDSNLTFKDKIANMKKSAIDMMTYEVDDTTINKKPGFFKGLMSKG